MLQFLDGNLLVYVVGALIPNLLVMLWVMARVHRDVRILQAKLSILESDNRVLDQGLKELADEVVHDRREMSALAKNGVPQPMEEQPTMERKDRASL